MAVGIPSLFPEPLHDSDSPAPEHQETKSIPNESVRLTEQDLKALRQFLLLLDKWDRQRRIA